MSQRKHAGLTPLDFRSNLLTPPSNGFYRCHLTHPSIPGGKRGVDQRWLLVGPEGAVHFLLWTNWHIEDVGKPNKLRPPIPADVGIHIKTIDGGTCPFMGRCRYKSLGTGHSLFSKLVNEGDGAVWAELEAIYERHIGGRPGSHSR
jgi:hypothetical protein